MKGAGGVVVVADDRGGAWEEVQGRRRRKGLWSEQKRGRKGKDTAQCCCFVSKMDLFYRACVK